MPKKLGLGIASFFLVQGKSVFRFNHHNLFPTIAFSLLENSRWLFPAQRKCNSGKNLGDA
jgi:hypothetical protein